MEFLFVIAIIVLIAIVMPKPGEVGGAKTSLTEKLVVKVKQCPPHQWYWQERVDENGVDQGARIVCKVCGPIASQSGREE